MARASALMLLLVLAAAAAAPSLGMMMGGPQKDFKKLVRFLKAKKNGYTDLLQALVSQGLDKAVLAAVKGGAKVTILAPSNAAFQRLKLKCAVKSVLLDHVISQRLPAAAVLAAPVGFTAATLGPRKITKLVASPLTVGIKKMSKVKSDAVVTAPDAVKTKTIIVHGIDTVLQAC